jgi:antitoxin ParD1/3/4
MPKSTSVILGAHLERFIARQIRSGRYRSRSEVVRASLHLLEHVEDAGRADRVEPKADGASFTIDDVLNEAREEASASPIDG